MKASHALALVFLVLGGGVARAEPRAIDEQPARAGEWGFRPAPDAVVTRRNPPSFSWRPQPGARRYEFQIARGGDFHRPVYTARDIAWNVHCPDRVLEAGAWTWRFRALDGRGRPSAWSRTRAFTVAEDAAVFVLPSRDDLLARVPTEHPRLFLRPEDLAALRADLARSRAQPWTRVQKLCDGLLADPPPTEEPPTYPAGVKPRGERWREIWWGNRVTTIRVLESAATLAVAWRLGGNEAYGALAKRLLLDAAAWDPKGATGYRYNDEAGMPYAYHFARTYTFLHPLLSEAERETCRTVMAIRGKAMYRHLCPRHLWRPYSSHANRAWHFLGEVGIAFLDEIPEAADWIWFAANVFANAYPVWSDDDGGWHEGVNYWSSYLGRFTWWSDVMRSALGLDAYRLPYFSQVGYYPMYLMPPGSVGGGFGDLNARVRSDRMRPLMSELARFANNAHWQWYVDVQGGSKPLPAYYGLLADPAHVPNAQPPNDLPTARLFAGIGQAALNTTLFDAKENVSVLFKSSPFGTQSHGYEAQNSFLLRAFGDRLLIRSGRRDMYGSAHHRDWMWHSKSVNNITINGGSQGKRTASAVGEITAFHTSEHVDYVEGEAGRAFPKGVKRFRRSIIFVKPDWIVIRDRLLVDEPSTFEFHLHAPVPFRTKSQGIIGLEAEHAACQISFLQPQGLVLSQTDRFDPPPRPRVKLREWHLTATRPGKRIAETFLTAIRVWKKSKPVEVVLVPEAAENGWLVRAGLGSKSALLLVRSEDEGVVAGGGLRVDADLGVLLLGLDGTELARYGAGGATLEGTPGP